MNSLNDSQRNKNVTYKWIYAIRKKLQQKLHCMTYHFARRKYAFTYLSSSSMAFVQSSMASVSFSIWQSTQTVTVLRTHFSWFCCVNCAAVCHMQWQTNWWTELVIKCLPTSITLVSLCINNFAVFNTSCLGCVKKPLGQISFKGIQIQRSDLKRVGYLQIWMGGSWLRWPSADQSQIEPLFFFCVSSCIVFRPHPRTVNNLPFVCFMTQELLSCCGTFVISS